MNHNTPAEVEPSESCVCKEVFIRHSSLSLPFRTHSGHKPDEYQENEEKPIQCKDCGKAFIASRLICHTGETTFMCKQHGKSLVLFGLHKHELTHSAEKPYACKQSGKAFLYLSTIAKQERTHSGEKPYVCKQCGKAFRWSTSLKIHETNHTGENCYECKKCDKAFSFLSLL
jgi:KRAB domain-containing zinc finger protein